MSVKQSSSISWNKRNRDKCREYSRRYQAKKKAAKEAKRLAVEKKTSKKKRVRIPFQENVKRLLDFYGKHGKKPSKTDRDDEQKRLWYWIDSLRRRDPEKYNVLKDQFLEKYEKDFDEVWNKKTPQPKTYLKNGVYKKREISIQVGINPFEDPEILLITIKNKDKEIQELKEKIKIMENTMILLNGIIV